MFSYRRAAERLSPPNGLLPLTDGHPCLQTVFFLLMASTSHPLLGTMDCSFLQGQRQCACDHNIWTVVNCRWCMAITAMHKRGLVKMPGNGLALSRWQRVSPRFLRTCSVFWMHVAACLLVKSHSCVLRLPGGVLQKQQRMSQKCGVFKMLWNTV